MFRCIYAGWVRHRRLEKADHAFRNRIYLMYLDLAELDQVFAGRWFWSTRRIAPFRFHRADHFGDPGESLAESVRREILTQTGETFQGSIRLLTQLRHFGFVFNPVSFYYCFAAPTATEPDFVVAEVNNTPWGQRHCYVLRPAEFSRKLTAAEAVTKVFHVSPLQLERRPVDTLNLARIMLAFPFSTFRVFAQIYWQALRLWWKRVPFVPHPAKGQPHGNQKLGQGSPHRQLSERTKLSAARQMRETSSPRVDAPAESLSSRTEPRPPVNIP